MTSTQILTGRRKPWLRWNAEEDAGTPVVVTYSFGDRPAPYAKGRFSAYQDWKPAQKDGIRTALETWADSAGIALVETPDAARGDLRFALVGMAGRTNATGGRLDGYAYYPGQYQTTVDGARQTRQTHDDIGGDLFLNARFTGDPQAFAPGRFGHSLVLHEIGHALGFKHPFSGEPSISYDAAHGGLTVLAYNRSDDTTELGRLDLQAMRQLNGAPGDTPKARWVDRKDVVSIQGSRGRDAFIATHLDDRISAKGKADRVFAGEGDDVVKGGGGGDRLDGGPGADLLKGGAGRDLLRGGEGDDDLRGGRGRDRLEGGAGDDRLDGGASRDRLEGGDGADTFVFARGGGKDRVLDWQPGLDLIALDRGADFDDLSFREHRGDLRIAYLDGAGEMRLENIGESQIDATDFALLA